MMKSFILVAVTFELLLLCSNGSGFPDEDEDKCSSSGLFRCGVPITPGHWCISQAWVCDGEADCPDGSDEPPSCQPVSCAPDKFQCRDQLLCIPSGWLCDGEADCVDQSDELGQECADDDFRCRPDEYRCDGTRICLRLDQLCDSLADCPDAVDEGPHCRISACSECLPGSKCRPTISGTLCQCPAGELFNTTSMSCADIDECAYDGYCDQICRNEPPNFSCDCYDGYRFTDVNHTRCALVQQTRLLLATSDGVLMMSQNGSSSRNTASDADLKTADFTDSDRTFCFLNSSSAVVKCFEQGSGATRSSESVHTTFSLSNVVQMAYDWLSQNWYFTDDQQEKIFLCRKDGTACVNLIYMDLNAPNSIAVDPLSDRLFFTTHGDSPGVQSASLVGLDRKLLVNSKQIVRPLGLTVDCANQHIYWSDSYLDRIERINYDGSNRRLVARHLPLKNINSLAVYDNFVFLTSQTNNSVMRISRFYHILSEPAVVSILNISAPVSIKSYQCAAQSQPRGRNNPCRNSTCNHVCVAHMEFTPPNITCLCMSGYKLGSQDGQCHAVTEDKFLLYSNAKHGEIKGISLEQGLTATNVTQITYEVIQPIADLGRPVALDYHRKTQQIYFSDVMHHTIGRRSVTESEVETVIAGVLNCEGIAIDWHGDNMYWTDEGMKTVSVARLDNTTIRRTLFSADITHPRAIVVHPQQGLMFWTDWVEYPSSQKSKIERASMDGSDRSIWVESELHWPNGLSIDFVSKRLYWCDAYYDRIEGVSLDSRDDRNIYANFGMNVRHPYGLVHYSVDSQLQSFFWTEFTTGQIMRYDVSRNKSTVVYADSVLLFDIILVDSTSTSQVDSDVCAQRSCEHLCLMSAQNQTVCQCADGFEINANDSSRCIAVEGGHSGMGVGPPGGCPHFLCDNGNCINTHWLCDGDDDCGDMSDESSDGVCQNFTCSGEGIYTCSNNRCIYLRWLCDGEDDCRTGEDEDERNCAQLTCAPDEVLCPNGYMCISRSWVCDGERDCEDGSDERNCTSVQCRADEFMCRNHDCISYDYYCDGDVDCEDHSDEEDCQYNTSTCSGRDQFLCLNTLLCINRSAVCDGTHDCGMGDVSDEAGCLLPPLRPPPGRTCRNGLPVTRDDYVCTSGECIPRSYLCDGDSDCDDSSDETHCNMTAMACAPVIEYRCPGENRCLPREWVCDGDNDCQDASDEANCTASVQCEMPDRHCVNDTTTCVKVEQLCDGMTQCADGSDEGLGCQHSICLIINLCEHTCHAAPDGFVCTCPPGEKLNADNITCSSASPCLNWGTCAHNCSDNGHRGHHCFCQEGYELASDMFTCKPVSNAKTFILFSNRHEIRQLDIEHETYVSLVSGLRNTIALDFYYNHSSTDGENSIIFWSDVVEDKIYKGSLILNSVTNIDTVVSHSIATAEGLAVDWITKHLYWVESNLDQIEVADFNGNNRLTLVAGFMDSPRAIALDPRVGLLFWTDWDRQHPRIERCTMSGDDRMVVVNVTSVHVSGMQSSGWPNGIAVDYELQRLYWIDARSDSIHTANYDGSDLREVLKGHEFLSHPFAISVFGNNVFWSDWRTNSLIRASKWNGTNVQLVERTITQPFDLHIFHPYRQPTFANPCELENRCVSPAVCLLTRNHQTACRCPHMTELINRTKCIPVQKFLMFARKQEIRGVYLSDPYFSAIPIITTPNVFNPVALDYVSTLTGKHLYWTESGTSANSKIGIHHANISSTTFDVIDSGTHSPYSFAVDWISDNLYFTGYSHGQAFIAVSKLNGAYRRLLSIPSDKLQSPVSLAVHPAKGLLLWSDAALGTVFASYLDGQQVQLLYHGNGSVSSNLSVDYTTNELWWIVRLSNDTTEIMHCVLGHLDSTACLPASFQPNSTSGILTALTVDSGTVYFARGEGHDSIEKISADGSGHSVLRQQTSDVRVMKVFVADQYRYPHDNKCSVNNGNCTQLCIPLPTSRACYCATGFELNQDGVTCEGIGSFVMYSNVTEIVGVSVTESERGLQALAPISRIELVVATDFHVADDNIYWVDSRARAIQRIHRDLTNREVLVSTGILSVEGVAVDWVVGNLYWTDSAQNCIEVSRLDGSHRFVVVQNDDESPRNIAVDPVRGFMYWTVIGKQPKIKSARLDGSDQQVLVNNSESLSILSPSSVALDYDKNWLFWCDLSLGNLDVIDLNTSAGQTLVTNITSCAGVSVLGDFIYWIDGTVQGGSILRASKMDGSGQAVVRSNLGQYVKNLAIFDSSRQPSAPQNPCATANGGCAELCLFNGTAPVCHCSHGHRVNGTQCADIDTFLAFSKVTGIETVHLSQSPSNLPNLNSPRPPVEDPARLRNVIGLAFDFQHSRYFFSDIQRGDIQSVSFDGSGFSVIVDNIGSAEGLAYDEVFQELYWTSYTNSSISRVSVDSWKARKVVKKMVQLAADDHPRAIVIDSCRSVMYWTNWNDYRASIMRSRLSGTDVEKIVMQDIETPNGLTIDHNAHKLYWSDARLDKIERCNYDGSGRRIVIRGYPQHVFGLTVFGDYLYWTDWLLRAVISANKYTGSDITYLRKNIVRQPMGIIAVSKDANYCRNDSCSTKTTRCQQNCEIDARGVAYCTCNAGFTLGNDKATCRPMNVTCPIDEFACSSGQCIGIEKTCDNPNQPDCSTGEDEDPNYCKTRLCPTGYFRCSNGRCIEKSKKCDKDGRDDCGDGSDEKGCSCNPHTEFQCASGERTCILALYRCDQEKDCLDASDEMGCPPMSCSASIQEQSSSFDSRQIIHCNHTTACIFPSWICDGHDDCWDNEDERDCSYRSTPVCDVGWRPCNVGGCVVDSWWCDGASDCYDGSDEWNCTVQCAAGEIRCDGNRCLPADWRCDGHADCIDHSDEAGCTLSCSPDRFRCTNSTGCIPRSWQCDGENDCPGGEDEHPQFGCQPRPCNPDEFQCHNWQCVRASFFCDGDRDCVDGSDEPDWCKYSSCNSVTEFSCAHTRQCIAIDKRCNGKPDCADQSDEDEAMCNLAVCAPDEYDCSHGKCVNAMAFCAVKETCTTRVEDDLVRQSCDVDECLRRPCTQDKVCIDKPIGFECQCPRGYELGKDNLTCVDINECDRFVCSQLCHNTIGSYWCECAPNYRLAPDKLTCKAALAHPRPFLLISNRYYLRNVTLDGSSIELLASDLQNAIALDFDWQDQYIYWSDVMSSGSNISRMFVNGTGREVLHSSTLRNPDGLAVDWIGRNLYWCDKTTDTIEVSRLNGLYRRVLVNTELQEPRAVAVHPFRGYLFYTDWGDNAHVGRLGMDGSERTRIVTKDMLGWPNALTIDYVRDEIIWADAKLDYIAISDLDAVSIRYLLRGNHLPHMFALTTFEDYIYWTDWEYKSIEKANRRTGTDRRNLTNTIHRPMGIQVFHPLRQPPHTKKDQRNPCANHGGCGNGTLCLIRPGGMDRICACPERHHPSVDKKTCIANCTSSEFPCATTYKCIPFWWKCDGVDDCGDGSDEPPDCRPYVCRQPQLFQCTVPDPTSADCISPLHICDGTPQCNDSSDELNCEAHTCLASQFKCRGANPHCIPRSLLCNGQFDCADGADEKSSLCPVRVCAWNQFECTNKHCIPYVWRCDGDDDCGDSSDETGPTTNCSSTPCPEGYLKCVKSGRCVPTSWRCDGDRDCGEDDRSDEPEDCRNTTCEPTYFKCANSRCIPGRWRCDYDDDCNDGSDELDCVRRNCSESEFRCRSDGRCLRRIALCDGVGQCSDRSDEDPRLCNASAVQCPNPTDFRCATSPFCIPSEWRCDGEHDCVDVSDEQNCPQLGHRCSSHELPCADGLCVPRSWWCDGVPDCMDKSDESVQKCNLNWTCEPGYARCSDGRCVLREFLCDGIRQCHDGSDEQSCAASICQKSQWQCEKSGECISRDRLCDEVFDCMDGSDEGAACQLNITCSKNSNCPKPYVCRRTPVRSIANLLQQLVQQFAYFKNPPQVSRCSCPEGQRMNLAGKCADHDPCSVFGQCPQRCHTNKNLCVCDHNYLSVTHGDRSTCVAKGHRPYVVLLSDFELYTILPNDTSSFIRQFPPDRNARILNRALKMTAADYVISGEKATLFIASQSEGAIYRYELPLKFGYPSPRSWSRFPRAADNVGMTRISLPQQSSIEGIAVDWVSDRIYWTEHGPTGSRIAMTGLNGTWQKTLINSTLHHPAAIAVDPESMRMFWTTLGVLHARIESAALDGTDRKVLVQSRIIWPSHLTVDHASRRLYWTDTKKRTVESARLDGGDRRIVWAFTLNGSHAYQPYKIDVFEEKLFVLLRDPVNVLILDKFGRMQETARELLPGQSPIPLTGLVVVQKSKKNMNLRANWTNPCSNHACGDSGNLCVNTQRGGARCMFSDDSEASGKLEVPKYGCYHYCRNGGICSLTEWNEPKCQCREQYTGRQCEDDACHGSCVMDNTRTCRPPGVGESLCVCKPEFEGLRCDHHKCDDRCLNGGTCIFDSMTSSATCQCPDTFKGDRCESRRQNACDGVVCFNGGTCLVKDAAYFQYRCQCDSHYTGRHCELCRMPGCSGPRCTHECKLCESPQCRSSVADVTYHTYCSVMTSDQITCHCSPGYRLVDSCPDCPLCVDSCSGLCHNGGSCFHETGSGNPLCECSVPYYGQYCEKKCASCNVSGTRNCSDAGCQCKDGWKGESCQTVSCGCYNGGTCRSQVKNDGCKCPLGYSGLLCHIHAGCTAVDCQNGGTCVENEKTYQCTCLDGFSGTLCESELVTSGSSREKLVVVLICIFTMLLVVFVVLAFMVYRRRHAAGMFKHQRMESETDGANVEIANPIYMRDYEDIDEDEVVEEHLFDGDKPTNFANPVYDSMFCEADADGLTPEGSTDQAEKSQLLSSASKNKRRKKTKSSPRHSPP